MNTVFEIHRALVMKGSKPPWSRKSHFSYNFLQPPGGTQPKHSNHVNLEKKHPAKVCRRRHHVRKMKIIHVSKMTCNIDIKASDG